mmetsp:Transcript_32767/g.62920  ORF Transcript_32767/g.62920 Transcript_32767/m.62920 type:complete len:352 (+) Transcript_32767:1385-2440(+)
MAIFIHMSVYTFLAITPRRSVWHVRVALLRARKRWRVTRATTCLRTMSFAAEPSAACSDRSSACFHALAMRAAAARFLSVSAASACASCTMGRFLLLGSVGSAEVRWLGRERAAMAEDELPAILPSPREPDPWCTTSCLELPGLWREGLAARRGAGVCSGKTLVHVVAALISSRFSAWCKPPADVAPVADTAAAAMAGITRLAASLNLLVLALSRTPTLSIAAGRSVQPLRSRFSTSDALMDTLKPRAGMGASSAPARVLMAVVKLCPMAAGSSRSPGPADLPGASWLAASATEEAAPLVGARPPPESEALLPRLAPNTLEGSFAGATVLSTCSVSRCLVPSRALLTLSRA